MLLRVHITAISLLWLCGHAHAEIDWRKDFLTSRGIGLSQEALKKAARNEMDDQATLEKSYQNLASTIFEERKEAQQLIQSKGPQIINFLKSKQPIDHPEIRKRVDEMLKQLESDTGHQQLLISQFAAQSLLEKPNDKATGGQFYEWFGQEKADLNEGYRQWTYDGPKDIAPTVKDGQLIISSKKPSDTDQKVVLQSSSWPQTKTFPKHFTVSCLMGSQIDGAGTYHPGIAIGKVKALMHPGYPGGGFRYENVDTKAVHTPNTTMGYTPKANVLYRIKITVKTMGSGKTHVNTVITSPENQRFEKTATFTQKEIGPINEISLIRSGRRGGDALFSDFHIEVHP